MYYNDFGCNDSGRNDTKMLPAHYAEWRGVSAV